MQKDAMDLVQENRDLKDRIRILETEIRHRAAVEYIEDAYYVKKENGEFDGPFCRVCWDSDKKLMRMSKGDYVGGKAACMVCNFVARTII
ncbi:hypothetical protein D3C76_1711420 [compost metagenome]